MYFPDRTTFKTLSQQGNLIPIYREIMADMDTPVSAFKKLDDGRFSFLLESIEGGEKWGRYSFLGSNPSLIVRSKGNIVETIENGQPFHFDRCETRQYLADAEQRVCSGTCGQLPVFNGFNDVPFAADDQ